MTKNIFSALLSIVICYLLHLSDPGGGKLKAGDYIGLVFVFVLVFFLSRWIFDKLKIFDETNSEANTSNSDIEKVRQDVIKYGKAKEAFKYFSNDKLKEMYDNQKDYKVGNMELLALEEILVERGVLDHSPMRENIYRLQKYFDSLNNK